MAAPVLALDGSHRAYVFGNSLVHHLSDTDETTVPHWLALIAAEGGHEFALSGQWGVLRDFRWTLPPKPNWSFGEVENSWDPERGSFAEADLDAVWITPANVIQGRDIDDPFEGDNPETLSPLDTTNAIFQWVSEQSPNATFLVYEGWPEMGSIPEGFPPSATALSGYHDFALGDYADWYDRYVAALRANGASVQLIPVSRVLSFVMSQTALSALPAETFYSDDAPHGTSATYLMAAMVAYNTLFDEPLPDSFRPPNGIAPEIRATFPMVRDAIWERVLAYKTMAEAAPAPTQAAAGAASAGAAQSPVYDEEVLNPSLAMGLNGIADGSVQHPFINLMKTARPWVGHSNDQWGAFSDEVIVAGGYLDENGWPMRLPEGARALEAFILTDQPQEATDLAGRYIVTYEGQGSLNIGGIADNVRRAGGEIAFDYTPREGLVSIAITQTDPDDYIRNIKVFREEHRALAEADVTFNPSFVARIENLRSLRFMDWQSTNGSRLSTWDERPTVETYSYMPKGVPVDVMIELSNLVGADPWFSMPHMADDAFMRNFAQVVQQSLRPELRAYVEYSNEMWNVDAPQATYAQEQARERWGRWAPHDAWMQFYGMRTAQMAQIWIDVFGESAGDRLVPVIATHTGKLGLEEAALNAPLWVAEDPNNWEPYVYVKAYAIAGYFGEEMGVEDGAPQVLDWIEQSSAAAQNEAATRGLEGAQADDFIAQNRFKLANAQVDAALREGSVKNLQEVIFTQHAQIAEDHGLKLVMYAGGTQVAVGGDFSQNETLIAYFKQFNYSPEMAGIYRDVLSSWKSAGGTLFNAFADVASPSQYGSWGTLRHLQDSNPRWDALMDFNAKTGAWWEDRETSTFQGGRILMGVNDADDIAGTAQSDVLAGLDGDDVLRPVGGRDLLLGGDGIDAALLPGAPSDYSFARLDTGLTVNGDGIEAELRDVEMLWFESDEELAIMTEDLR